MGPRAGTFLTTGSFNIDIGNTGEAGITASSGLVFRGTTNTVIVGISGLTVPPSEGTPSILMAMANWHGDLVTTLQRGHQEHGRGQRGPLCVAGDLQIQAGDRPEGARNSASWPRRWLKADPNFVVRDASNDIYTVRYEAVNAMLLNESTSNTARSRTGGGDSGLEGGWINWNN